MQPNGQENAPDFYIDITLQYVVGCIYLVNIIITVGMLISSRKRYTGKQMSYVLTTLTCLAKYLEVSDGNIITQVFLLAENLNE